MTSLTYQKDARAYRFSLPNEIWGLKLPPPAFSILAYLCYLNSHHKCESMPSVDEIAELLHMSVAMIPNEPHPNPDAAHSVGSASSCATSKFASQNKERKPVRN